jgi:Holliday junction resolvase RusA-like endonuclease
MRGWDIPQQNIRIEITVVKPIPITHRNYGDIDNLAKTVLDALPIDDRYVSVLIVRKERGDTPSLRIRLYPDACECASCGCPTSLASQDGNPDIHIE